MWGNMPNKYWSQARFDEATNLSGVSMMESILTRSVSCYGCSVACGREVTLKDTPYGIEVVDGPEYETVSMLGSMLLIDDLPAVAYAGHLCNRWGLDTVSAGSSIALAYLLYERGFLTPADTGGLPLEWGDSETAHILLELIARREGWGDSETAHILLELIARREGFGDILAQGVKRIAAHFGAEDLAMHVKGLEPPAHDPRAGRHGADHPRGGRLPQRSFQDAEQGPRGDQHPGLAQSLRQRHHVRLCQSHCPPPGQAPLNRHRLVVGYRLVAADRGADIQPQTGFQQPAGPAAGRRPLARAVLHPNVKRLSGAHAAHGKATGRTSARNWSAWA